MLHRVKSKVNYTIFSNRIKINNLLKSISINLCISIILEDISKMSHI